MTITPQPQAEDDMLGRDLRHAVRYYLGGRRGLIAAAAVVGIPGLWVGWPWLVAAGIAPLLIALAPCAIMCGLGLCMNRMTGRNCSSDQAANADASAVDPDSPDETSQRQRPDQSAASNRLPD